MLTTTITVFSRDKAYSDALAILRAAHESVCIDTPISTGQFEFAESLLYNAKVYLAGQWREYQESRAARMKGKV